MFVPQHSQSIVNMSVLVSQLIASPGKVVQFEACYATLSVLIISVLDQNVDVITWLVVIGVPCSGLLCILLFQSYIEDSLQLLF